MLASKGIEPTSHDSVVPGVDSPVNDGSRIAVRLGRPLALSIDGEKRTVWTTATKVSSALEQVGVRFGGAALSVSRSANIDRSGMSLSLTTPKKVALKVADDKVEKHNVPATTVGDLLSEVDAGVDRNDIVRPSRSAELTDGTRVVVTKIGTRTKRVPRETIPASVTEQKDDSMMEGETETVREGSDGVRDVTYKLRFRNGEVVKRTIVKQRCSASRSPRSSRSAPRPSPRPRRPTSPAVARSGTQIAAVRVRWQLGRQHRQRLLRRAAVQPRHLAVLRRLRACRTRTAASSRSPWPSASLLPRAATAPGRTAVPSSAERLQ